MNKFRLLATVCAAALGTASVGHAAQIGFGELNLLGSATVTDGQPQALVFTSEAGYEFSLPEPSVSADYTISALLQIGPDVLIDTTTVFNDSTFFDVLADPLIGQLSNGLSILSTQSSGGFVIGGLTIGFDAAFTPVDENSGKGTITGFATDLEAGTFAALFGKVPTNEPTPFSLSVSFDAQADLAPVPLPASLTLLGLGLGGLCVARRRKATDKAA